MAQVDLFWDPYDLRDPGPIIDVAVMNSKDVLGRWRESGLECPPPIAMKALLDTGASVTVISKKFAEHCKLLQTNEGSEITAIGATHRCGEHAGSVSFPGTQLRAFDSMRIVSATFAKERYYAILIGRDILRNWAISFDGRSKRITIND